MAWFLNKGGGRGGEGRGRGGSQKLGVRAYQLIELCQGYFVQLCLAFKAKVEGNEIGNFEDTGANRHLPTDNLWCQCRHGFNLDDRPNGRTRKFTA